MARRRILVVDESSAMRETLCVLLGGDYDVTAIAPLQLPYVGDVESAPLDLTIAPAGLASRDLLPPGPRLWLGGSQLSRRFRPSELRREVAAALTVPADAGGARANADWRLSEPFLERAARITVERAHATGLALHIAGEPGSGKHAVARALHSRSGGAFLVCDGDRPTPAPADLGCGHATLLAIGVDRWPAAAQRALASFLTARPAARMRVISTATGDLAELLDRDEFLPELYYQLTLLAIRLWPLRDRPHDIPAIALAIAAEAAERMQRPLASFSPPALERLSRYLWFGNVAELQAVVIRTLALTADASIAAGDLAFSAALAPSSTAPAGRDTAIEPNQSVPSAGDAGVPEAGVPIRSGAAVSATPAATGGNLGMLIHELAHEFKNPLVTIKTFAQHLQRSRDAGDPDEAQFARMTDHAIDRMDDTLENLLAFTRLAPPATRTIGLDDLLQPLAGNGSGPHLDFVPGPPLAVRVDPAQTAYALDNLLRALARDARPDRPLVARVAPPDSLHCTAIVGSDSTGANLRELVGDDAGATANEMPLGVAIASAVLERNGAHLDWCRDGDTRTAIIRFPVVEIEEEAEGGTHGESQSTGSR